LRLAHYAPLPLLLSTDPAPTQFYTLSLHDALPISQGGRSFVHRKKRGEGHPGGILRFRVPPLRGRAPNPGGVRPHQRRLDALLRSEEHTSELQSLTNLVCRLLLEKKKNDLTRTILS